MVMKIKMKEYCPSCNGIYYNHNDINCLYRYTQAGWIAPELKSLKKFTVELQVSYDIITDTENNAREIALDITSPKWLELAKIKVNSDIISVLGVPIK